MGSSEFRSVCDIGGIEVTHCVNINDVSVTFSWSIIDAESMPTMICSPEQQYLIQEIMD